MPPMLADTFGSEGWDRTSDRFVNSELLCLLSYLGKMVGSIHNLGTP